MSDTWTAIDALQAQFSVPPRPPGSFTLAEYMERYGLRRATARDTLQRMVADGALLKQQAIVDGIRSNVYSVPEAPDVPRRGKPRK